MSIQFKNSLFIQLVTATLTLGRFAHSYELEVKCDSRGNVVSQIMKSSELSARHAGELASDINVFNRDSSECAVKTLFALPINPFNGMALVSEQNSRARTWSTRKQNPSTYFDRQKIKNIIQSALKAEVDPYAALALAIMEDPPYVTAKGGHMGSTITQSSAAEALGCRVAKNPRELGSRNQLSADELRRFENYRKLERGCTVNKPEACVEYRMLESELAEIAITNKEKFHQISCFSDPSCAGVVMPPDKKKEIDLTSSTRNSSITKNICVGSTLQKSDAYFTAVDDEGASQNQCCVQTKLSRASLPKDPQELKNEINSQVSAYVFLQMIKNKIQNQQREPPAGLSTAAKVAWLLQAYNGRGVMPKSSGSLCLSGVDMGETPVYGATGGDVMMNMLMLSPELAELIESSRVECSVKVKSIFCAGEMEGTHRVNSQDFAKLEESFLSKKKGRFKTCSKGDPEMSFRAWTPAESKIYFGE